MDQVEISSGWDVPRVYRWTSCWVLKQQQELCLLDVLLFLTLCARSLWSLRSRLSNLGTTREKWVSPPMTHTTGVAGHSLSSFHLLHGRGHYYCQLSLYNVALAERNLTEVPLSTVSKFIAFPLQQCAGLSPWADWISTNSFACGNPRSVYYGYFPPTTVREDGAGSLMPQPLLRSFCLFLDAPVGESPPRSLTYGRYCFPHLPLRHVCSRMDN